MKKHFSLPLLLSKSSVISHFFTWFIMESCLFQFGRVILTLLLHQNFWILRRIDNIRIFIFDLFQVPAFIPVVIPHFSVFVWVIICDYLFILDIKFYSFRIHLFIFWCMAITWLLHWAQNIRSSSGGSNTWRQFRWFSSSRSWFMASNWFSTMIATSHGN